MLPKKERKKKDKLPVTQDSKLSIPGAGFAKTKFSLTNTKDIVSGLTGLKSPQTPAVAAATDLDDPYAFSDGGPAEGKLPSGQGIGGLTHVTADSVLGKSLQSGQGFVRSASDIATSSSSSCLSMAGGSIIAKFYPELAEKLEKARAKPVAEPKSALKSRARTSRTMNKLQTKIAQNKINEKLRKSQELNFSLTDSNSSPLQMSSPEQSFSVEHSPSPGGDFSPASTTSQSFSPQAGTTPTPTPQFHQHSIGLSGLSSTLAGYEQGHLAISQEVPPLPQVDTSFLATLAAQDNLGFHSGVGEDASSSAAITGVAGGDLPGTERLQLPQTPPRLPPPYPGSSTLSTPSSLTSPEAPSVSVACGQARAQAGSLLQTGPSGPQSELVAIGPPFTPLQHPSRHRNLPGQVPQAFLSPPSSSPNLSAKTSNYRFSSAREGLVAPARLSQPPQISAPPPPSSSSLTPLVPGSTSDIFSMLSLAHKQVGGLDLGTGLLQQSPNALAAHASLPPPPPYVAPSVLSKVTTPTHQPSTTASSKIRVTTSVHSMLTSSVPKMSVPHTKLRKLRGLLPEQSAKRKLKSDLACNYYSHYAKRKKDNHCYTESSLFSSDDGTEDEDANLLPWQRDMFSASSDEDDEPNEEEDDEFGNVPMSIRPTKISLLKTQLRRQWVQGRRAAQVNTEVRQSQREATLALIRTARESGASAVRTLWQIEHVKKSKKQLRKKKTKFKQCCQKSEKEGQCKNDNYQRLLELENKKKPRKKSKPPALTRPPRKGKKKKKGRYSKPQKPMPPPQSIAFDSTLSDVDVTSIDPARPEDELEVVPPNTGQVEIPGDVKVTQAPTLVTSGGQTGAATSNLGSSDKETTKHLDHATLELPDSLLSSDFDKQFELPLEQATNLLEESDLQEVVNKLPFDALDLFGKGGEAEQEADAGVDLPAQHSTSSGTSVVTSSDLNSAARSKEALEKLLSGTMSEEESMQLAMVLAQSLHSDAELGRHARLLAEAGGVTTVDGLAGVEVGMGPGMAGVDAALFGGAPNVTTAESDVVGGVGSGALSHSGVGGYGGIDMVGGTQGAAGMGEIGVGGVSGSVTEGNFMLPSSATPGMGHTPLMPAHGDKVVALGGSGGIRVPPPSQSLGVHDHSLPAAEVGAKKVGVGHVGQVRRVDVAYHPNLQLPVTGPPAYPLSSTVTPSKSGDQAVLKTVKSSQPSHLQQQQQLQLQQKQQQQRLQQQAHLQRLQQRQILQQQQQLNQTVVSSASPASVEAPDGVPSILTTDLNTVYNHIESLSRFQMAPQRTPGVGINHLVSTSLDPASAQQTTTTTAKTVIRHLPTGTVSSPTSVPRVANTLASSQITLSSGASQRSAASEGAGSVTKNTLSSPPNVCLQQQPSRVAMNVNSALATLVTSSSCLTTTSPSVPTVQLSKVTSAQSQLQPLQSQALKMQQQQQQQLHQLQLQQQQLHQQQLRASPATVKYMLQVASSSSSLAASSPSPLPSRAKLVLPEKPGKSSEITLQRASPKPFGLPKFSPGSHRLNLNSAAYQDGTKQSNFPPRPAQTNDSSRLKLTSSGTKLLDSNTNKISITKSFNTKASSASPSPPSFSQLSSSPKPSGFVKLLPGGGTSGPTSSSSSSSSSSTSSLVSTTFRPHNLLEGADNSETELISVTVRQPSSMESVPSTVRHTLPDVCPTAMTLPSTPPLQLPSSLSHPQTMASLQPPQPQMSLSSSPRLKTPQNIVTSKSPSSIKLSGRQHSLPTSPLQQHSALRGTSVSTSGVTSLHAPGQHNGLQFQSTVPSAGGVVSIGSRAAQVVNKFQGNKAAKAKNKGNSVAAAAAEAARLSALASAAGVPVVCNPVSLQGFASGQGLPTTTFKSTGSS
ncbi:INO80 complex subunit D [Elysia marginata]|uniref:INO80 complex subunit D n=1 Tax=Elysia marginata TaxID=1093978 RepID=A0AAV4FRU3_9GAST|nr:INO80 complex subunit D [Elysia marginata]